MSSAGYGTGGSRSASCASASHGSWPRSFLAVTDHILRQVMMLAVRNERTAARPSYAALPLTARAAVTNMSAPKPQASAQVGHATKPQYPLKDCPATRKNPK